jgi:two-component system, OmpR family, sensor histidine kinase TctE
MLTEFAGDVAHELRTPLAGIRAQAAYALAQDDPAAWRAGLQGIAMTEQRASRLVEQLLALARASEPGAALKMETIALDELVREVVLRFLPKAAALGVDLGAGGLDDRVEVRCDAALLEGILNNLIDNALRYGRGGASPRTTVAIHRQEDAVVLSVTDNGSGLGTADPEHLTRRWAQGAQGRELGEGAGLGLSIVRRHADLLNADFSLQAVSPGPGLCAVLRLNVHT